MKSNKKKQWILITIIDPSFLHGKSIYDVIKSILEVLNIKFVVIADIEGAGTNSLINDQKMAVFSIDELLSRLCLVTQFDWGDFFLFSDYPSDWQEFEMRSYEDIISLTETTVRAVDDSYLYIYTPYEEVSKQIEKKFEIDEIMVGDLSELEYPY